MQIILVSVIWKSYQCSTYVKFYPEFFEVKHLISHYPVIRMMWVSSISGFLPRPWLQSIIYISNFQLVFYPSTHDGWCWLLIYLDLFLLTFVLSPYSACSLILFSNFLYSILSIKLYYLFSVYWFRSSVLYHSLWLTLNFEHAYVT